MNAEIAQAHADFVRANGAAPRHGLPVFEEELEVLRREIQVLNAKLIPLHIRLAGLRSWAAMKNAVKDGPEREPFHRLMVAANARDAGRARVGPYAHPRDGKHCLGGA